MIKGDTMTREEGKDATLKRIRHAIANLLRTKGYENIKVRDICKEANISIGTFYNYFDSKDTIIEDTIKFGDYFSKEVIMPQIDEEHILDSFLAYIDKKVSLIDTLSPQMMREVFRMFLYRGGTEFFSKEHDDYQFYYSVIKLGQEKGQIATRMTAEEYAECIIKNIFGSCYVWCILQGDYDINTKIQNEIKHLLQS